MDSDVDTKFCIYCGEKIKSDSKWCMYCGENLENDSNNGISSDSQMNSLKEESSPQNEEFESYIIRLQKNFSSPTLIDLPSFREVNFYKVDDHFAYVTHIPDITEEDAKKYIKESTDHTNKNSGLTGSFIAPTSVHVMVSNNVSQDLIKFILDSEKIKRGLIKGALLMSAIYDLDNNALYYKKKSGFVGAMKNDTINRFIERFNL